MGTNSRINEDTSLIEKMISFESDDEFLKIEYCPQKEHYLIKINKGTNIRGILVREDKRYLFINLAKNGIGRKESIDALLLQENGEPCFPETQDKNETERYPETNFLLDCYFSDSDLQLPQKFDSEQRKIDLTKPGYFAVVRKEYAKNIRIIR